MGPRRLLLVQHLLSPSLGLRRCTAAVGGFGRPLCRVLGETSGAHPWRPSAEQELKSRPEERGRWCNDTIHWMRKASLFQWWNRLFSFFHLNHFFLPEQWMEEAKCLFLEDLKAQCAKCDLMKKNCCEYTLLLLNLLALCNAFTNIRIIN